MVRKLIVLVLVVAVVFIAWTVSVVGALAEAWAKMPPTSTAQDGSPGLTLGYDASSHLWVGYDFMPGADVS